MPSSQSSSRPSWQILSIAAFSYLTTTQGLGFECGNVVADGIHWDLAALSGVHNVYHSVLQPPSLANWTFSIDLCGTIPFDKDISSDRQCPHGTKVCGIKTIHDASNDTAEPEMDQWVAIAGHYDMSSGNSLEVKPTRLKSTGNREGLVLELTGGKDPFKKQKGVTQIKQKAIVELLCNKEKSGWEPAEEPKSKMIRRDDEEDAPEDDPPEENVGSALTFHSYGDEIVRDEIWGTLRLQWETKYACEDAESNSPPSTSGGWGFFTWIIIILFLGIAGYVIMGSWVNYTQYGARGFDLVPHADTIRDIPYIMKDMFRKAQSGGSRGGYSAV